jgi:hypothetical protein
MEKIEVIGMLMQLEPFTHDLSIEYYERDEVFKGIYQ